MRGIRREKMEEFVDKDAVTPKGRGLVFWDASCLEVQYLGWKALRAYGLGLTEMNSATHLLTKPQLNWRPACFQLFYGQYGVAFPYGFTDAYWKIHLSLTYHQPRTSIHILHNPSASLNYNLSACLKNLKECDVFETVRSPSDWVEISQWIEALSLEDLQLGRRIQRMWLQKLFLW